MKATTIRLLSILLLGLPVTLSLWADVSVPAVFGDHMVLQRNRPVPVWGTASAGECVTVTFGKQSISTTACSNGTWQLYLAPMETCAEGKALRISGKNEITFNDVLVGEVWLCSGQSNMEKPLGEKGGQKPTEGYQEELQRCEDSQIRLFQVPQYSKVTKEAFHLRWMPCSAETLEESAFSAVGYYFAKTLRRETGLPVGIIHSSFGGTMIEAWIPKTALESDPQLSVLLDEKYFAWVEGVQATELYNSMIRPLVPFAVHGFLWYQGEANLMNGDGLVYTRKMEALVSSWRDAWKQPNTPFLYVQLAPFNYSDWDSFPKQQTRQALPLFWEAQADALHIPDTAMVVTTDLAGNARDIHPIQKREVGERLAWLAQQWLPDVKVTQCRRASPLYRDHFVCGNQVTLHFSNLHNGLTTSDGNPPDSFEIAGANRVFLPAKATIKENAIIVASPGIEEPVAIRFGWDEIARPNLSTADGLPVGPFRTDCWSIQNEK